MRAGQLSKTTATEACARAFLFFLYKTKVQHTAAAEPDTEASARGLREASGPFGQRSSKLIDRAARTTDISEGPGRGIPSVPSKSRSETTKDTRATPRFSSVMVFHCRVTLSVSHNIYRCQHVQ